MMPADTFDRKSSTTARVPLIVAGNFTLPLNRLSNAARLRLLLGFRMSAIAAASRPMMASPSLRAVLPRPSGMALKAL